MPVQPDAAAWEWYAKGGEVLQFDKSQEDAAVASCILQIFL
jgi:hypothetical protein